MNTKTIGLGIGAFTFGALAVLVGVAVGRGRGAGLPALLADKLPDAVRDRLPASIGDGHVPTDLAPGTDLGADHRAPEAFRPNMDAPMTPAEREALRPATGPAPSLVADEGSGAMQDTGAA
jgi:hypothetical protein